MVCRMLFKFTVLRADDHNRFSGVLIIRLKVVVLITVSLPSLSDELVFTHSQIERESLVVTFGAPMFPQVVQGNLLKFAVLRADYCDRVMCSGICNL